MTHTKLRISFFRNYWNIVSGGQNFRFQISFVQNHSHVFDGTNSPGSSWRNSTNSVSSKTFNRVGHETIDDLDFHDSNQRMFIFILTAKPSVGNGQKQTSTHYFKNFLNVYKCVPGIYNKYLKSLPRLFFIYIPKLGHGDPTNPKILAVFGSPACTTSLPVVGTILMPQRWSGEYFVAVQLEIRRIRRFQIRRPQFGRSGFPRMVSGRWRAYWKAD